MTKIKFCPFCGSKTRMGPYDLGQAKQYAPYCEKCKVGFLYWKHEEIRLLPYPDFGFFGEKELIAVCDEARGGEKIE